jgi:uncharacterized protein (TIGR00299 family) protein
MSLALYVDLFSGAAGDMLLGALLDLGLELEDLRADLALLPLRGWAVSAEKVISHGIRGTQVTVRDELQEQPARTLPGVRELYAASRLPEPVKATALRVFERLARAEAGVHGIGIDQVHFHELGAVDTLVDVTGFVAGLARLGVQQVFCSEVPLGGGTVQTAHGLLPVPAPATLALLTEAGAPTRPHPARTEILTPTAAALLAELAEFRFPAMTLRRAGYGVGRKELPWANVTRAWLGELTGPGKPVEGAAPEDTVVLIETNLDNSSGEALGFALERLLAAGALDVWFTPIQMKKNRPGVTLSLLVQASRSSELAELVLRETPTLGVRLSPPLGRLTAVRRSREVATRWGPVRVKEKWLDGELAGLAPEYEDCARLAREHGVGWEQVRQEALRVAQG